MTANDIIPGRRRHAATTRIDESASGTPDRNATGHQYGRRVEGDRSWTVYHVFTGIPARMDDRPMTGLSRSAATEGMLSLNSRHGARVDEQTAPAAGFRPSPCAEEGRGP
ncbi:MAG: hypothetical protein F9K19_22315 [Rhizobiaceae bacterium]|nr:MAG: hypothetical protein F9K19_22315 [Rhizobiaceae bacterium]CAG0975779.1 hypothetical protein RHIZO_01470 [Rhizobiaceae bacterium]